MEGFTNGQISGSTVTSATLSETHETTADILKEIEVSGAGMEMTALISILHQDDIWICDTGASCHSTKSKVGAINERKSGSTSLGQAGEALKATSTIDLKGQCVWRDGSLGMKVTLTDCSYNACHNFNLASLTRLMSRNWVIVKGDMTGITVRHPSGSVIDFDIVIPTEKGAIFACWFICDAELACISTEAGTTMNITKAHGLLGHGNEEATRQTSKELGWVITRGKLDPCLHCAKSKAKQKNVCKASENEKVTEPEELIFLDLSTIKVAKDDGSEFDLTKKNWKIMVDKATGKKWSDFTPTKDGMVEPTCQFLHKSKQSGRPVKAI